LERSIFYFGTFDFYFPNIREFFYTRDWEFSAAKSTPYTAIFIRKRHFFNF